MQRGEVRNPVMVFALCMFTCGIYAIYWMFTVVGEVNAALGEERFNMLKEVGLSIVTCGMWGYYFMWRFSEAVVDVQVAANVEPVMDAPILFVTGLFGLSPFFIQQSLNHAWEDGSATATPHVPGDSWDDRMNE